MGTLRPLCAAQARAHNTPRTALVKCVIEIAIEFVIEIVIETCHRASKTMASTVRSD